MTPNIEHLLRVARSGDVRARAIVLTLTEHLTALDGRSQDGVHELVELIARNNGLRHDIKDVIDAE